MKNIYFLFLLFFLLQYCDTEEISPVERYQLKVTSVLGGSTNIAQGTFEIGESVTITAESSEGYLFDGWEEIESDESTITLTISENTTLTPIFVEATYIPDSEFEKIFIENNLDNNQDNYIKKTVSESISQLVIEENKVSDFTGIEDFKNLEILKIVGQNEINQLNLRSNLKLKSLHIENIGIDQIDISKNVALLTLIIKDVEIETIDISKNILLEYVYINGAGLNSIDLSENINLTRLVLQVNNLSSIDLSNNSKLEELYISYNQLETIDLSNNSELRLFNGIGNRFTSLDLSFQNLLETLELSDNPNLNCISISDTRINQINEIISDPNIVELNSSNCEEDTLEDSSDAQSEVNTTENSDETAQGGSENPNTTNDLNTEGTPDSNNFYENNPDYIELPTQFANHLKTNYSVNGSGRYLLKTDLESMSRLWVVEGDLDSLSGLSHLKNLKELIIGTMCSDQFIQGTPIGNGTMTSWLDPLDISGLTKLENLVIRDVVNEKLTSIDLTNNTKLKVLILHKLDNILQLDLRPIEDLNVFNWKRTNADYANDKGFCLVYNEDQIDKHDRLFSTYYGCGGWNDQNIDYVTEPCDIENEYKLTGQRRESVFVDKGVFRLSYNEVYEQPNWIEYNYRRTQRDSTFNHSQVNLDVNTFRNINNYYIENDIHTSNIYDYVNSNYTHVNIVPHGIFSYDEYLTNLTYSFLNVVMGFKNTANNGTQRFFDLIGGRIDHLVATETDQVSVRLDIDFERDDSLDRIRGVKVPNSFSIQITTSSGEKECYYAKNNVYSSDSFINLDSTRVNCE